MKRMQTVVVRTGRNRYTKVKWNGRVDKCRGSRCDKMIRSCLTRHGKWMPVDPPIHDDGICEPHFATCIDVGEFVRRKRAK